MKYIVIGLGNLGREISLSLTRIGNEVIGIDINPGLIDGVKHLISGAVCLDTTNKEALSSLPLADVDAVIVTYGKDFGVSIKTVALLKNLKVNRLIVRRISSIQEAVVKAIGVEEIISPEKDFAEFYTSQALLGDLFKQWYRITDDYNLYKIVAPQTLIGQSLRSISFQENFSLRLVGIEQPKEVKNILGLSVIQNQVVDNLADDYVVQKNDTLFLFGKIEAVNKLIKI